MYKPTYKKRTARMISWVCGSVVERADRLFSAVGNGHHYPSATVIAGSFSADNGISVAFPCTLLFPVVRRVGIAYVHCSSNRVECTIVHQLDMAHGLYFFVYPCDMDGSAFPGS